MSFNKLFKGKLTNHVFKLERVQKEIGTVRVNLKLSDFLLSGKLEV